MKFAVLFVLIGAAFLVSAVPVKKSFDGLNKEYPGFIKFPDGDGKLHDVDLEAPLDAEVLDEITRNPANNLYLLFTRRNARLPQTLTMNNANSIINSNFNANVPTVFIAHGWLGSQNDSMNPTIRDAVLGDSDCNVIVLDWSRLASSSYDTATAGVPTVGRGLGQFINFLSSTTGAPLSSMHLVGFCLGAHLVGNAGRELGGRAARVTGLDPAGPLWHYNTNRLRANDGVYVESIHTNGGILGIGFAVGDADFFPNGGTHQPGCLHNLCSHNRAWELFASTVIHNNLIGRRCSSFVQVTLNTCTGGVPSFLPMGNNDLNKTGCGLYIVNTARTYPF